MSSLELLWWDRTSDRYMNLSIKDSCSAGCKKCQCIDIRGDATYEFLYLVITLNSDCWPMSLLATPFKGPTCRVSEMKGNALQSMCPPAFRIVLDLLGLEPIHHLPLSKKTNKAPPRASWMPQPTVCFLGILWIFNDSGRLSLHDRKHVHES